MILATDLDGTFLAGDAATRHRLYQLVSLHADVDLIFVTGRGLESVLPLLSDPTIPQPKYIICDVGATVVEGAAIVALPELGGTERLQASGLPLFTLVTFQGH